MSVLNDRFIWIRERRLQQAGENAFEGCVLKTLDYETSSGKKKDGGTGPGVSVTVACPGGANGFGSDYFEAGKELARQDLAESAGRAACRNCTFATMSRLSYTELRIQEEAALIELAETKKRRLAIEAEVEAAVEAAARQYLVQTDIQVADALPPAIPMSVDERATEG